MAVAFSSNDSDVIQRSVTDSNGAIKVTDIESSFEIQRCVDWIQERKLEKVALQFPDSLLQHSPDVVSMIEAQIGNRVYVLGDTSYGECCADEVASEHIGADAIIHFGPACLTPTVRLPILYIYTIQGLNVEKLEECVISKFDQSDKIAIVYDVQYDRALEALHQNKNIFLCKPHPPSRESDEVIECGRKWPEGVLKESEEWKIIYVGTSENLISLLTFTFPSSAHFVFDPVKEVLAESGMKCSKLMMRRYMLVEKTKDAERIGILVGTLGVSRYGQIIEQVKESIKKANKKAYTFLVGKPNIPKLANFPEIDVFVLIACPENSLLDSKEYLKPIVTPFELDVALNSNREWTGVYHANFQDLLPDGNSFKEFEEEKSEGDLSLISGKLRIKDKSGLPSEEGALMVQDTRVSNLHTNGGGDFLSQRTWQGLEQKLGETEAVKAVEGQRGIAWGYANEGQ